MEKSKFISGKTQWKDQIMEEIGVKIKYNSQLYAFTNRGRRNKN